MSRIARIAVCPEHGLHGERLACFECGGPVERPLFVQVPTLSAQRALLWAICKLFGPLPTDAELDGLDTMIAEESASL